MEDIYDVVVVGTGFVGTTIENILSIGNLKYLTIQPENENFKFRWSKKTIINERHIKKARKLHGGMKFWGGAVSLPLRNKKLSNPDAFFETISEFRKNRNTLKLFGINLRFNIKNRYLNRSLENLGFPPTCWVEEKNYYAGKKFSSRFFALKSSSYVVCQIIEIKKLNNEFFKLTIIRNQKVIEIKTKEIISAAGNFMNAKILQLVETKKRKHPIGNHVYADIGEVALAKPVLISELFQTYYPHDRKFYNLRFSNNYQQITTDISIRLIPVELEESKIEFNLFKTTSWARTRIQESRSQNLYGHKKVMVKRFKILMYVNILPNQSNYFSISKANNVYYKLEIDKKTKEDIGKCFKQILADMQEATKSSKLMHKINTQSRIDWKDAAHYYGSTTQFTNNSSKSEPKSSGAPEGIYFLGGSSLQNTWDIHPTYLYVRNAIDFMNSYPRSNSKFSR